MIKEKELAKKASLLERLVEKSLEWYEYLRNALFRRSEAWCSHLVEYYCVHKSFAEENFVKEFLEDRKAILKRNHHRMVVNIIPDDSDSTIVGKVLLYNKDRYIHEATLRIREPFTGNNIIFWCFEK
jgi:hypothetical protein